MRSSIYVLAVVTLLVVAGFSFIGTGLSMEPEKTAIWIGDSPTPEPTIGQWVWDNLVPAEVREALLRRLEPPAITAPAEPREPDVFIPAPKPEVYRFEMIDPREACKGCMIIVSGVTGSIEVRLREQELDGSWRSVTYGADEPIGEMLDAFVIKLSSGKLYIALWYWGEPSGVVPDDGYISLDDYLALDPLATEPQRETVSVLGTNGLEVILDRSGHVLILQREFDVQLLALDQIYYGVKIESLIEAGLTEGNDGIWITFITVEGDKVMRAQTTFPFRAYEWPAGTVKR